MIKRVPVAVRLWSAVGVLITTAALTATLSLGLVVEMGEDADKLTTAAKQSAKRSITRFKGRPRT